MIPAMIAATVRHRRYIAGGAVSVTTLPAPMLAYTMAYGGDVVSPIDYFNLVANPLMGFYVGYNLLNNLEELKAARQNFVMKRSQALHFQQIKWPHSEQMQMCRTVARLGARVGSAGGIAAHCFATAVWLFGCMFAGDTEHAAELLRFNACMLLPFIATGAGVGAMGGAGLAYLGSARALWG